MNKFMTILITAVTAMGLFAASLSLTPSRAEAAVPTSGLADCETGVPCTFYIGTIPLTTNDEVTVVDEPDGGRRLVGSIDLPTPGGAISLVEAELFFDWSESDYDFVGGETRLPFPQIGFLADADVKDVAKALFGVRPGSELQHLGAHLRPHIDYLYFYFSSAFKVGMPWADDPAMVVLPDAISIDAGKTGTLVIDPSDPYVYVGSDCPELTPPPDAKKGTDAGGETDKKDGSGENTDGVAPDTDTPNTDKTKEEEEDEEAATKARRKEIADSIGNLYTASKGDLSQDCGIGFSLNGNIPGPGGPGQEPISGHVVIDGKGPLPYSMAFDGSLVVEIKVGVRAVGFGKISAKVPFIGDFVDISFPLGDALVDLEMSSERIGYALSGMLENDGTLPIEDLPLVLPGDGSVRIASQFAGIRSADGDWQFDPDSFFEAEGDIGVGPKALGEAIGVELDNFAAAEAYVRVDRHALTVAGSIDAGIHRSLETDAGMSLDAMISFDAPETSYLYAEGDMQVAGTELGAAELTIDRNGFFVTGMLTNTVTTVEMAGEITATGASLEGTGTLVVPLDGLGEAAGALIDDIDAAQRDVDSINHQIDDLTVLLTKERHEATADLRAAQTAVTNAQRSVDSLNANIASNNRKIKVLKGRISSEKRRFKRLKWYKRIKQAGTHSRRLASWNAGIAGLRTANAANATARTVAIGTLEAAKATLRTTEDALNLVPFEADPRMIALVAGRETATVTLQAARSAAGPLAQLHGSFRGTINVRLATDGLSGGASAEWCTDACVVLASARTVINDSGMLVCAVPAPGSPEVCGRL